MLKRKTLIPGSLYEVSGGRYDGKVRYLSGGILAEFPLNSIVMFLSHSTSNKHHNFLYKSLKITIHNSWEFNEIIIVD